MLACSDHVGRNYLRNSNEDISPQHTGKCNWPLRGNFLVAQCDRLMSLNILSPLVHKLSLALFIGFRVHLYWLPT